MEMKIIYRPDDPEQVYVYYLEDVRTNDPFYVGTTTNPQKRLQQHVNSGNQRLRKRIREIGIENVVLRVVSLTDPIFRYDDEQSHISSLISSGSSLSNYVSAKRLKK